MCLFDTYLRLYTVISFLPNRYHYVFTRASARDDSSPPSPCHTHKKACAHRRHPVHDLIFKYNKKHNVHAEAAEQEGGQREHGK